jgi:hypothetical protein
MSVETAVHSYTKERLNCAQSILKAFGYKKDMTENEIEVARAFGGGRADGGVCGALHAALLLLDGPAKKKWLRDTFAEHAGSEKCREIRAKKIITCGRCVELAAELLEAEAGAGHQKPVKE